MDGIIFASAQTSRKDARNIALFPHASTTQGLAEEKPRVFKKSWHSVTGAEDDEMFVALPTDLSVEALLDEASATEPALRLVPDGIIVTAVMGITYELQQSPLRIYTEDRSHGGAEDDRDGEDEGNEDHQIQFHPLRD